MRGIGAVSPKAVQAASEVFTAGLAELFPTTSEGQAGFIAGSLRPYQAWVGGRGIGKTYALSAKALALALENGGRYRDDGTPVPVRGLILGRTGDEVTNKIVPYLDEHVRRFRELTGVPLVAGYSSKDVCYTLTNGVQLFLRSYGQPRTLAQVRGWSLTFMLADEVAHAEVDSNQLLRVGTWCVRDSTAPARCFAVTTSPDGARGIVGHFLKKWQAGHPDYAMWSTSILECSHVTAEDIAERRSGSTEETWAQEGLGLILQPSHIIYPQFSEARNIRPAPRRNARGRHIVDPSHYWALAIDWGTNNAWVGVVDIAPSGRWVILAQKKYTGGSATEFRREVRSIHDYWARLYGRCFDIAGTDRAVPTENGWLRSSYPDSRWGVLSCEGKAEQKRRAGIALVQWMLKPLEGEPRLYLSDELERGQTEDDMGIRDAIPAYCHMTRRVRGVLTVMDEPEENTPPTHPCDGVRYLVTVSRHYEELHGGEPLPAIIDEDLERLPYEPTDPE
ncbi:MAG: hypothetical protein H6697_09975 [Myxococcales bacterium]|nr:hypothetical protein [Myxococcales bacterium]